MIQLRKARRSRSVYSRGSSWSSALKLGPKNHVIYGFWDRIPEWHYNNGTLWVLLQLPMGPSTITVHVPKVGISTT